jgi:hypothetical protein
MFSKEPLSNVRGEDLDLWLEFYPAHVVLLQGPGERDSLVCGAYPSSISEKVEVFRLQCFLVHPGK